jgi:multidrug efflux pump subunit AcrA (membrane-fusion protein)
VRPMTTFIALALLLSGNISPAGEVRVPNCLLSLAEETLVPAQEAGMLTAIPVREGQAVAKGDLLAQIDDLVPQMQRNVAFYKLKVAEKEAADDIDVRYAVAAYQFADARLRRSLASNAKIPGTVSEEMIDEQRLEREKFRLAIEQAKKKLDVAGLQKQVSEAELAAAEAGVKRRKITAVLDAVVVELSRHEGEWVQAGDPVMRLVRVDRLRVQGYLNAKNHDMAELQDRPVRVTVPLAGGRSETVEGKIVYVEPLVGAGGDFLVRAEVDNLRQNNAWVLRPGLGAEMTIITR